MRSSVLVLLLTLVPAFAPAKADIMLAPGGTYPDVTADANSEPAGAVLVAGPVTISGSNYSVTEEVYRESSLTYDFLFQVKNTGAAYLGSFDVSSFSGYTLKGGYETAVPAGFAAGTIGSPTIALSGDGSTVAFHFNGAGIGRNETSDVFSVQTSATGFNQFASGLLTDSNAASYTVSNLYGPGPAAVPEPSSLVLLALGIASVGAYGRSRRRRRLSASA